MMKQAVKSANGTPKISMASPSVRVEPSQRWVRVEFNEQIVADSKEPILVWSSGHMVTYYFPEEDVRQELLTPSRRGGDGKQYFDLQVGDRTVEAAAWSYPEPAPQSAAPRSAEAAPQSAESEQPALIGYVTFKWNKMDHWYEEEEEIFVHPRDPHHRVDAIPSSRHIRVEVDGVIVADTKRPVLLFETGMPVRYYIPQEDIRMDLLSPTRAVTHCPYKGASSYWSIKIGDQVRRNVVWGYLDPVEEIPKIKGLLSFFNEKLDICIDGELEKRPETLWS
jgi:uncharacterized protein (DUF427 family)